MNKLIILFSIILFMAFFPLIEGAAGSRGALIQLATSSTDTRTMPYGYSPWVRPVMQRGMYFGNPRFVR